MKFRSSTDLHAKDLGKKGDTFRSPCRNESPIPTISSLFSSAVIRKSLYHTCDQIAEQRSILNLRIWGTSIMPVSNSCDFGQLGKHRSFEVWNSEEFLFDAKLRPRPNTPLQSLSCWSRYVQSMMTHQLMAGIFLSDLLKGRFYTFKILWNFLQCISFLIVTC